jgi:hypothetical protein
MSQIFLTNDCEKAPFDRGDRTVWLHHDKDEINANRTIKLSSFLDDPRSAVANSDLLVVCGLVTKLCRPSNRVKLGQFLTEPWWGPKRASVDSCLFIGEPWRMWWHWGCIERPFANYFTSYRLESDWNRHIELETDNPCSIERIIEFGNGHVQHCDGFRFGSINIHIEKFSDAKHSSYAEEKEKSFAEEKTIKAIIRRLSAFADASYPDRSIPKDLFASTDHEIRVTDFGVDMYLLKRIRETIELTNAIAEAFQC